MRPGCGWCGGGTDVPAPPVAPAVRRRHRSRCFPRPRFPARCSRPGHPARQAEYCRAPHRSPLPKKRPPQDYRVCLHLHLDGLAPGRRPAATGLIRATGRRPVVWPRLVHVSGPHAYSPHTQIRRGALATFPAPRTAIAQRYVERHKPSHLAQRCSQADSFTVHYLPSWPEIVPLIRVTLRNYHQALDTRVRRG